MKILIIGAGIAGLSSAALLQKEHDVTVIESRDKEHQKGYAMGIWADTMPVFEQLGIKDEIISKGQVNPDYWHCTHEGEPLVYANFGEEVYIVELPHAVLRNALEDCVQTPIRYETTISKLEEDADGVNATINGKNERYDIVLGADGIHSWTRENYFSSTKKVVGWVAHYGWATVPDDLPAKVTECWKPGAMIGMYSHGENRGCVIAFTPEGVSFKEGFIDFSGVGAEIRDSADEIHASSLYWVKCRKRHTDRILLIGDAAHGMPPFGGVGATMALEDSWVLSKELDKNTADSFKRFAKRRKSRIKLAKKETNQQWRWKRIRNPFLGRIRNLIAPLIPAKHFIKGFRKLVHDEP